MKTNPAKLTDLVAFFLDYDTNKDDKTTPDGVVGIR